MTKIISYFDICLIQRLITDIQTVLIYSMHDELPGEKYWDILVLYYYYYTVP
jgi:hypothetical protein